MLSSTGHLCVVENAMALLLKGVLGGSRFDTVVPVPLHRVRLAERGFTWAGDLRGCGKDRGARFG